MSEAVSGLPRTASTVELDGGCSFNCCWLQNSGMIHPVSLEVRLVVIIQTVTGIEVNGEVYFLRLLEYRPSAQ